MWVSNYIYIKRGYKSIPYIQRRLNPTADKGHWWINVSNSKQWVLIPSRTIISLTLWSTVYHDMSRQVLIFVSVHNDAIQKPYSYIVFYTYLRTW